MGLAAATMTACLACSGASDLAVPATTTTVSTTGTSTGTGENRDAGGTATGAAGAPRDERIGPPANGRPAEPGLKEGTCFVEYLEAQGEALRHRLTLLDCTTPHDGEIFALVALAGEASAPFPGEKAVARDAQRHCLDAFVDFVGLEYATSTLRIATLRPTRTSWEAGDRTVVCSVYHKGLEPLTGSQRASGH